MNDIEQDIISNQSHGLNTYKDALQSRVGELKILVGAEGYNSLRRTGLRKNAIQTQDDLQKCRNRLGGRTPQIYLTSTWVFLLATCIVLVTEAFVNKVLFDMALLSNSIISIAASALVSGFLVLIAHLAGLNIRQVWSDFHHRIIWSKLLWGIICVFVIFWIVVGIMYTRAFFDATSIASGDINVFQDVAKQAFSDGFSKLLAKAFSSSESTVMGTVNFLALFGAFSVAALSHDSDIELDQRYRGAQSARKRLEKHQDNFSSKIQKIYKKYETPVRNSKRAFIDAGGNSDLLPVDDIQQELGLAGENRPSNQSSREPAPAAQMGVTNEQQKISWHDVK